MARETGLEPATSGVTGRRSNQLSYSRKDRISGLQGPGLKGAALPSQAQPLSYQHGLPGPVAFLALDSRSTLKIAIFALSIQKRRYLRAKLVGRSAPNQISPDLSEVLHTATYEEAKNG